VQLKIGDAVLPVFKKLIDLISSAVDWLASLPQPVYDVIAAAAALAAAILSIHGALLILNGAKKMWPMFWKLSVESLKTSWRQLFGMVNSVSTLIALAGILYYAWEKNFGGIKDMFSALSAGWQLFTSAGKDGIARISKEQADALRKAGLLDIAVDIGAVFWRLGKFWDGLKDGVLKGIDNIKNKLSEWLGPLLGAGQGFLDMLGMLDSAAGSNSDSWTAWGEKIGGVITVLTFFFVAVKLLTVAFMILKPIILVFTTILDLIPYKAAIAKFALEMLSGGIGLIGKAITGLSSLVAANPFIAICAIAIGAVLLLWKYWDGFGAWMQGFADSVAMWFSGAWDIIAGLFHTVIGALTLDWKRFVDGICRIFKGVVEVVSGVVKLILNIFSPVIDLFSWIGKKLGLIEDSAAPMEASVENRANLALAQQGYVDESGAPLQNSLPVDLEHADAETLARYASAPHIAQANQNAAALQGQAVVSAAAGMPEKTVKVESKTNVKVEPTKVNIELDGNRLGEGMIEWQERQDVRAGAGAY